MKERNFRLKILDEDRILESIEENNERYPNGSFAHSMNRYHILEERITPEVLIVGTITPEGGKGYYYTSLHDDERGNRREYNIYNYIKNAYGNQQPFNYDFVSNITNMGILPNEKMCRNSPEQRMKSQEYENNSITIDSIKEILKSKGIFFFDVLSSVIRTNHSSPFDKDIKYASFDIDSFEKINISNNCRIIVNSKLALEYLLRIIKKCNRDSEFDGKLLYYAPQLSRALRRKTYNLDDNVELKEIWKTFLTYTNPNEINNFKKLIYDYSNHKWLY